MSICLPSSQAWPWRDLSRIDLPKICSNKITLRPTHSPDSLLHKIKSDIYIITEFDSSPPSAIFQLSRGSLGHIQQYSSYIMVQKRLNHYQTWQGHPGSRTISRQKRETGLDKLKNPTDTAKCPVALRWRKAKNPTVKGSRKETTVPLGEQPEPSDIKNEWSDSYQNGGY